MSVTFYHSNNYHTLSLHTPGSISCSAHRGGEDGYTTLRVGDVGGGSTEITFFHREASAEVMQVLAIIHALMTAPAAIQPTPAVLQEVDA